MLQPVGKVTVSAAGTPVAVRTILPATWPSDKPFLCHAFQVQALPTNTGKIWVGTIGLVKATFINVLNILPIPTTNTLPSYSAALTLAPNGLDLCQLYIDADTNGEGCIISVMVL